ncbi:hypothetical protein BGZ49_002805 [Haplosporangium sp. Z 27]|nr:hypothetical protein BGZ49_002805 [Haplosporangium sp. Z 27]
MRSSLLLVIASILFSSVSAHEGHEHPVTTPGCLETPTNTTCSSFVIPVANIATAISDICKTSSFLPGCSLNTACSADSTLNATYCAPLTILATLCTATEDVNVTSPVCSKTYSVFCSKDSLIPGCKSQPAFPGLPSGKIVTDAVYSVCKEMPMMTDCKICPGPDATTGYSNCDEVKALKGLCLDMPEMSQCSSYNAMCNSTKFTPFCSNDYTAPKNSTTTVPTNTPITTTTTAAGGHASHSTNGAGVFTSSLVMTTLVAVVVGVSGFIL